MRCLTSILCLVLGTVAHAAETWRWVDANGVIHYSDQPQPGAERVELQSAPLPGSTTPPAPPPSRAATPTERVEYTCGIIAPTPDQVFFNVQSVNVALRVQPALQEGQAIRVQLNGRPVTDWPASSTNHPLQNLSRGSFEIVVLVTGPGGDIACRSAPVTFHIRQPSLLSPARQGQRGTVPAAPAAPRAPLAPGRP